MAEKNVPHVPHVPHAPQIISLINKSTNRNKYLPCQTCSQFFRSDTLERHKKSHENTKNEQISGKSARRLLRKNNENSNIFLSKKTDKIFRKSKRIFKQNKINKD